MIWARWGSVKLVKAQHRCIVTNPLGERPDVGLLARTISHDAFVSLVAPAFIPGMPDQDFMAICKRTFHVVFLRDRAYVRYPGEDKVPVKQIEYPGGVADLLIDSCKPMLGAYKRGDELDTARVNQNRRWTGLMVRKVLGGELVGDYIDANLDVPDEDVRPRDGDALPGSSANVGPLRLVDVKEEARAAESASASRPRGSTDTLAADADAQPRKRPRTFQFRSSQGVGKSGGHRFGCSG